MPNTSSPPPLTIPPRRCHHCKQTLPLHALQRVWPAHNGPNDQAGQPFESLVAEARCDRCNYTNFISLPTTNGRLFGLPDELAQLMIQGCYGRDRTSTEPYHVIFGQRARLWSLIHKISLQTAIRQAQREADHES